MMSKGTLEREVGCRSDLHSKQIGEKAREKNRRVYVDFIYLEKAYDRSIGKLFGKC